MPVTWDPAKHRSNLEKHHIDFRDVARAFDGIIVARKDERRDYGEERYRALGEVDGVVFELVYTIRAGSIRLISAWHAGERGRRAYARLRSPSGPTGAN